MRKILLAVLVCGAAAGQSLVEPPPIVQLVRKPGTGGASIRAYANAGAAVNAIGMRSVTGLPETWILEAHTSFASVEELDRKLAALSPATVSNNPADPLNDDVLAPARVMLAVYRPEWSYRADQAIRALARARYVQVSVFRIRPGTENLFTEVARLRRATADGVNLDRPELGYQVMSGAPAGTLVFLAPLASLRAMDEGVAPLPVYAEGLNAAREKERAKLAETELGREHLLFRVEPAISYVSDDFASADVNFWRKQ